MDFKELLDAHLNAVIERYGEYPAISFGYEIEDDHISSRVLVRGEILTTLIDEHGKITNTVINQKTPEGVSCLKFP